MKKLSSVLLVIVFLLTLSGGAAAVPNGKGSGIIDPYNLKLTALKGKIQTDLYVNVQPKVGGYTAPESLKKIQLKSFDPETEELVYTRNFNDEIPSPNGKGAVIINNVERYQPLKTMVHIKNNETQNEVILEGNTQVFLRPDLVIDSIQSPSEVQPNTPFGMSAQIKEINSDVGATAKIEVLNGDVVLDSIDSFSLEAGNERGAALLPTLNEVGTYMLTLRISGADPVEYDTANNEKTFIVKVVEPAKPINYSSSYSLWEYESNYNYQDYFGYYQEWTNKERRENFNLSGSTTAPVDPTGTFNVKFSNENGDQFEVNFTLNKNYDVWYEYIYHGYDWATQTFVDIYPSSWGANIYLYHYAGDFAYSFKWRSLYGYSGGYDSSSANGSFINAKTKVGATINLPSNDGIQHGGNLEYTISPSYYQSWDYTNDGWGDYTSHSWGYNTRYFGWGSGLTTTE